jgi:uncharacterized protein (DUF427 family)
VQNVWDFPRPPAVVACERRVRVEVAGVVVADSTNALCVLETSHPPTVYVPRADVREELLVASDARGTTCEFKGRADYLDVTVGHEWRRQVAWTYPEPWVGYEALARHVSFYPGRVDRACLGDEQVTSQEGDFYGGWITQDLVGPFKGPAGTLGW